MTNPSIPKRYEVRSLLGEGGSGRVFRVQDSIRDRELALKLVTAAESAFLRREFDTLRQIRHENLIQVFDWGALPSGEAYYTMELIEGGDWSRRMGKPQPPDDVRHILTGLLRGLAHLHCHGEIHGDLKPGNILLGAGGVVKITDAGMGGSGGRVEGMSGTPGYAAPEVWEGSPADIRSDLYSVGVMAYEALTGKHPFAGRTVRDVVSGQLEGWVSSPGVHGVRVPVDLERVMMRALERKPGLRQGSADEFMEGMGVEDRIGEILGGKLVGREKEMARIEEILLSTEPGTPTLLYVTGEPGVGRTAFLEELGQRAIREGARLSRLNSLFETSPEVQIGEFLHLEDPDLNLANITESLWKQSAERPVVFWTSPAIEEEAPGDSLRPLARFLWALSRERNIRTRVLFVVSATGVPPQLESFENALHLGPFSYEDTLTYVGGLLGNAHLEEALLSHMHKVSGGNADALTSTITSLIEQRLITRRENRWFFRENQTIQSIQVPTLTGPWSSSWTHLSETERRTLITIELLPAGIPQNRSGSPLDYDDVVEILLAKGWVRRNASRVGISSEGIRSAIRAGANPTDRKQAALALLELDGMLTREERADLAMAYQSGQIALDEGRWAADAALKRKDYRRAASRLERCLRIATELKNADVAREISLRLAELLHTAGEDERAEWCLTELFAWREAAEGTPLANREYQLGTIYASLGKLDNASNKFTTAIRLSTDVKDDSLLLRAHAGLAQIEWQHHGGDVRETSMEKIRGILGDYKGRAGLENEVAALTYGLGAALVRTGQQSEATEVLKSGLSMNCSEYWRMRLCNALSTAAFYSSEAPDALDWISKAWDIAEKSGFDSFKARILSNKGSMLYGLGRLREAVDHHSLSYRWATRMGSAFELTAACSGVSINLTMLAEYEAAIVKAKEARTVAETLRDRGQQAKAMELEALALYHLGSYENAEAVIGKAQVLVEDYGSLEVRPRLNWLLARVALVRGDLERAEKLLAEAELTLLETKDWEDLPGVQIEIQRLLARTSPEGSVREIVRLMKEAEARSLLLVQIHAGVALAEIAMIAPGSMVVRDLLPVLEKMLGKAETIGALDAAWKLSFGLASVAATTGDSRTGRVRSTNALRIIREIAARLGSNHRSTFIQSPHVASALSAVASGAPVR